MQHYTSCHWIQHGLSFENDHIEMCCLCCHKGGGRLHIKDEYKGKGLKWDDIFKLKEKFIEENKKGIIDPRCEGCFNLVHKDWDDDQKYINYLHFNHWTHCNSDCIYCYTSWDKKNYQKKPHYKVMPMLKELFKKKLFHPNGEITFAGGEPTQYYKFEDILNLLNKSSVTNIVVHSNVINYSKAIENGIKRGTVSLCVSVDAGSKKTHENVKGVKSFDKVWKHIEKYAKVKNPINNNYISLKYIIIPGLNDTKEEIDEFINRAIKAKVDKLLINADNNIFIRQKDEKEQKAILKKVVEIADHFIERVREHNISYLIEFNVNSAYKLCNLVVPFEE